MNKINAWPLYVLGIRLAEFAAALSRDPVYDRERLKHPDRELDELPVGDIMRTAMLAVQVLDHFLRGDFVPLTDSVNVAKRLRAAVSAFLNYPALKNDKARLQMRYEYKDAFAEFEQDMLRELPSLNLYHAPQVLAFEMTALINEAETVFPESIRAALPKVIRDEVRAAGQALAFGLDSAVGFHVLRAIERAILEYFTIPGFGRLNAKTWNMYATRLDQLHVHPKIVYMVRRLEALHRGELMHAEAVLGPEEAAMIFALCQELLPLLIADVAKRLGKPVAHFPVLDDPRWKPPTENPRS